MAHTVICFISALAFGILAVGLQAPSAHSDRFTRTRVECNPTNYHGRNVVVCTEVFRAK